MVPSQDSNPLPVNSKFDARSVAPLHHLMTFTKKCIWSNCNKKQQLLEPTESAQIATKYQRNKWNNSQQNTGKQFNILQRKLQHKGLTVNLAFINTHNRAPSILACSNIAVHCPAMRKTDLNQFARPNRFD